MKSLARTTTRSVAAGVAGVLVAGAATVLAAAPAQAAKAEGELRWGISQNFVEHLYYSKMGVMPTTTTGSVSGGAAHVAGDATTGADDVFTFPAASVTTDGGTTVATYTGTVSGAFTFSGTEQYRVTVTDPVVTSDAAGAGRIEATVSASNIASQQAPAASTEPTKVTVAEFTGATTVDGVLSGTPNWENVLELDTETANDLGITKAGSLTGGRSFSPSFLGALTAGTRAHFHNSSATSVQDHKRPAAFSTDVDSVPTVTPKVVAAHRTVGIDLTVTATDFPAGATGAYVILAPSDTVIDPGNMDAGMAAAVAVDWVRAAQIVGEKFTMGLLAPRGKVVPGTNYSVFTIPAHGVANPDQVTTTPVTVNWTAYSAKLASKTTLKVTKKATRKKAGAVAVTVTGKHVKPAGKVTATLKIAGVKKAKKVTVTLKNGKATVKLPRATKKGTYKVTVKYAGNANFKASTKATNFKVK